MYRGWLQLTARAVHPVRLWAVVALAALVLAATAGSASAHEVAQTKWLPAATVVFLFDRQVAIGSGRAVSAAKCTGFGPSIRYKPSPSVRAFKHFRCRSLLVRKTGGLYKRIGTATFVLHLIVTKQKFLLDQIKLTLD